jgi:hypothetical protein
MNVASVIKNRIKHPGFNRGKFATMEEVIRQRHAFSSIGSRNWRLSANPELMTIKENNILVECSYWSKSDFIPFKGPVRPIVYFHDKSINMPKSWNNRWWTAIKEIETEYFIFYSVKRK